MSMDMAPSWLDLPQDVVQIICEKLIKVIDYVRFGAVCRLWRTVAWLNHKKIPPQLIMLPDSSCIASGKTYKHTFFTLCVKDICKDITKDICYSAGYGWLLTRAVSNRRSLTYQLFNPFLSENNVIKLPFPMECRIIKAVLSDNPALTSDYLVMALYFLSNYIYIFRSGDTHCTHIVGPNDLIDDIMYFKDQFYVVTNNGEELMRCDISRSKRPMLTRVASLPGKTRKTNRTLVISSGDLLCVVRESVYDLSGRLSTIVGLQIFKFQTSRVETQWIELKTLNDHTLFLGDTSLASLPSNFSPYKPNHIYFAYSFGMVAFNLEDRSVEELFSDKNYDDRVIPVWVQPTLNMIRSQDYHVGYCPGHVQVQQNASNFQGNLHISLMNN